MIISGIAIAALALPIVILGPRPGLEIVQPLAVVLLGGVVSSLIVALLLLPSAYLHLIPPRAEEAPPGTRASCNRSLQPPERDHRAPRADFTRPDIVCWAAVRQRPPSGSHWLVVQRSRSVSAGTVRTGDAGIDRPVSARQDHRHRGGQRAEWRCTTTIVGGRAGELTVKHGALVYDKKGLPWVFRSCCASDLRPFGCHRHTCRW